MNINNIGRLQKADLCEVWASEVCELHALVGAGGEPKIAGLSRRYRDGDGVAGEEGRAVPRGL